MFLSRPSVWLPGEDVEAAKITNWRKKYYVLDLNSFSFVVHNDIENGISNKKNKKWFFVEHQRYLKEAINWKTKEG